MSLYNFYLFVLIALAVLEAGTFFIVRYLSNSYQWLITSKDELPEFDRKSLNKFLKHGFNPVLGWVRKPNTSGKEDGKFGKVTYHINSRGARLNPGHEELPALISCYGDSFAFSRQVNDDETWEYYLSKLTTTNVLNFGVGNYGLDQALLRLKLAYHSNPTQIVILSVVPETICRILNVWKHYNEYGNTFGFKPRYRLDNGNLTLVENIITDGSMFFKLQEHLPFIQQNDYFYKNKFKKDILRFPYLWSLFKTWRRNVPLIFRLMLKRFYDFVGVQKDYLQHIHNVSVLQRNIKMCAQLYQVESIRKLMVEIVKEFVKFSQINNFTPVFVLLPQLNDITYIKENRCYYFSFVKEIKNMLTTIDLTDCLVSHGDLKLIYSNDHYGGHFSKVGNEFVANQISKFIGEKKFLHAD